MGLRSGRKREKGDGAWHLKISLGLQVQQSLPGKKSESVRKRPCGCLKADGFLLTAPAQRALRHKLQRVITSQLAGNPIKRYSSERVIREEFFK